MEKLKNIKKIAVLRANALGDFIFVIPALRALRETYKEAEITYLGKPWHADFLKKRCPFVDRFLVVPKYSGVGEDRTVQKKGKILENFFSKMKKERFDLALQLHGGGRNSNPFLLRLGARITAGLKTPDAKAPDISIPYFFYQSEVMRYLEVARAVGAETEKIEPEIKLLPKDFYFVHKIFSSRERFVVFHPGASDLRRRWAPENFAEVANALLPRNVKIVITGSLEEKHIAKKIIKKTRARVLDLCGKMSLGDLAGLLAESELVISNDTGPLHLAQAVGAKTIGIFWCGNMINGGPFTRLRHRPLISWQINCPLCGKDIAGPGFPFQPDRRDVNPAFLQKQNKTCKHEVSFVDYVKPQEVIFHALGLLNEKK